MYLLKRTGNAGTGKGMRLYSLRPICYRVPGFVHTPVK